MVQTKLAYLVFFSERVHYWHQGQTQCLYAMAEAWWTFGKQGELFFVLLSIASATKSLSQFPVLSKHETRNHLHTGSLHNAPFVANDNINVKYTLSSHSTAMLAAHAEYRPSMLPCTAQLQGKNGLVPYCTVYRIVIMPMLTGWFASLFSSFSCHLPHSLPWGKSEIFSHFCSAYSTQYTSTVCGQYHMWAFLIRRRGERRGGICL